MSAWSHLPNAKHIDQVLADPKAHPDEFAAAWDAVSWNAAWSAAVGAAWDAARDAARSAAHDAARRCALGGLVHAAIAALVAWDHSSKYLTMTYQELNMWYQLNEDPAALLLLPYLKAQEFISQKIRT
jgi:hypothetical protein